MITAKEAKAVRKRYEAEQNQRFFWARVNAARKSIRSMERDLQCRGLAYCFKHEIVDIVSRFFKKRGFCVGVDDLGLTVEGK